MRRESTISISTSRISSWNWEREARDVFTSSTSTVPRSPIPSNPINGSPTSCAWTDRPRSRAERASRLPKPIDSDFSGPTWRGIERGSLSLRDISRGCCVAGGGIEWAGPLNVYSTAEPSAPGSHPRLLRKDLSSHRKNGRCRAESGATLDPKGFERIPPFSSGGKWYPVPRR